MIVAYQVEFQESSLNRTLPNGRSDTCPLDLNEISQLEKECKDFKWNLSNDLSQQIGKRLFNLLNGDEQTLKIALSEAEAHGKKLQLILKGEGLASTLPFELLYHNDFLVPSQIHLFRRVSERGNKRKLAPKNQPLKLLLMVCSPLDLYPVLEFEKEEDTIFEVTKDLPMEIDIEDSGSLEGFGEQLAANKYDVVHISGHADIDDNGEPFFWMENDEGLPVQITPLQLWKKLDLNLPRLVFLSGCRTGEAPEHMATMSFAHRLVKGHIPAVLGWGLPVSDIGASFAAKKLYFELSRGENILDAILRTRRELFEHSLDWSILRLFSDGTPLDVPLVISGLKRQPKPRALQYIYLEDSQVKVLKRGFIGRRRQIQQGIRCMRRDIKKVGLLLHGTGGLGKSCLAGKFCERFKDHQLIIVHGVLNAITFHEALNHSFRRINDNEGLEILKLKEELPDKIERLCYSAFQKRNYLILLDDFEKNLVGTEEGHPEVYSEAVPILESILRFLPSTDKMTQLIITSRYTFSLTLEGIDIVEKRLESIGLTTFLDADEKKKVSELDNIVNYPNPEIRRQLIKAGHGNPRLMEALNILIGVKGKDLDLTQLLTLIKNAKEEFIQGLVLDQILKAQPEEFQKFLSRSAVFQLSIFKEGIEAVCGDINDLDSHLEKAVRLSLMEKDSTRQEYRYWVTPLIRENLFGELEKEEMKKCHKTAISYYYTVLSREYSPILSVELIEHAVKGGFSEIAVDEGVRLLSFLRFSLAYREALECGNYILANVPELKNEDKYSNFLSELGYLYHETGDPRQSIDYFEQALSIYKEVYGDRHPYVTVSLNNIGVSYLELGEPKKSLEYFEQALSIEKELIGSRHRVIAARLNNIGNSWLSIGEPKKSLEYFESALSIYKEAYGDRHPKVAIVLNNIGRVWIEFGEPEKALDYCEQAFSIDKEVCGDKHPDTAIDLGTIGDLMRELGEPKKSLRYCEQALSIFKECYGERHPKVATACTGVGNSWRELGEPEKALDYYEQAFSIDKEVYGEKHLDTAICLGNIGYSWRELGHSGRAKEYFQQAIVVFRELLGDEHPYTLDVQHQLDSLRENLIN